MNADLILAYERLQGECRCTADDVVCDPHLRHRFLELTRNAGVLDPENVVLHRLLNLRKKKRLPRLG